MNIQYVALYFYVLSLTLPIRCFCDVHTLEVQHDVNFSHFNLSDFLHHRRCKNGSKSIDLFGRLVSNVKWETIQRRADAPWCENMTKIGSAIMVALVSAEANQFKRVKLLPNLVRLDSLSNAESLLSRLILSYQPLLILFLLRLTIQRVICSLFLLWTRVKADIGCFWQNHWQVQPRPDNDPQARNSHY